MASHCLVTSLNTVLCCACQSCQVIRYDSVYSLHPPSLQSPLRGSLGTLGPLPF